MILREHEMIDIPTGSGPMRLHVLRPAATGRFPGVVLFSEIYQVTAPIRRLAAMIAGLGYVVAVPEVYHEYEAAGTVLAYDQPGTDRGNALKYTKPITAYDDDARAAIAWLADHPACTGRIGTMGVCLGGHLALRAAMNGAVSAAACFYATDIHSSTLGEGRQDDTLRRIGEISGELLMVWGRQDPHVPFAGRQVIRETFEAANARYEWYEVNGQHAFLRDEGHRYDPALFLQCMAWVRSMFERTLRPG